MVNDLSMQQRAKNSKLYEETHGPGAIKTLQDMGFKVEFKGSYIVTHERYPGLFLTHTFIHAILPMIVPALYLLTEAEVSAARGRLN